MPCDSHDDQRHGTGRGRRRRPRRGRHTGKPTIGPRPAGMVAGIVLATAGLASAAIAAPTTTFGTAAAADPAPSGGAERAADTRASRNLSRPTTAATSSLPPAPATPTAVVPPPEPPAAPSPTRPAPVAGLDQAAMDNAAAVVEAGRRMNLPKRAYLVAIVTTLQESRLRNLANPRVPESLSLPNEGTGHDYDSVGLFQQRPSQGWGSVHDLMDPAASARAFYSRLVTVPGWEQMNAGDAAQAVQRSAFPDAYRQHQARAQQIVDALA
ncbi:hypothetical protein ACNTMW_17265 [Planosporangium sp. 12N6]|uniref:hypothetical protein n=1 Tax=Planosporangium spinosum TaxID=3402278 RepID=UPI003CED028A